MTALIDRPACRYLLTLLLVAAGGAVSVWAYSSSFGP